MNTDNDTDPRLDQHLRHVLVTVANTVTAEEKVVPVPVPVHESRKRNHRRRIGIIAGAAAIPVAFAAAAVIRSGPEYVDQIPPDTIILKGSVDGSEYLLVESRRTACGKPVQGVELVEESKNLLGTEWNTTGTEYGEPDARGCGTDTERYLANPALFNDGGSQVGDSMVWIWAVHPDVTGVRITAEGDVQELPVHAVDGAGYVLFEVPKDIETYTAELLINGEVVPGSEEAHRANPHRD